MSIGKIYWDLIENAPNGKRIAEHPRVNLSIIVETETSVIRTPDLDLSKQVPEEWSFLTRQTGHTSFQHRKRYKIFPSACVLAIKDFVTFQVRTTSDPHYVSVVIDTSDATSSSGILKRWPMVKYRQVDVSVEESSQEQNDTFRHMTCEAFILPQTRTSSCRVFVFLTLLLRLYVATSEIYNNRCLCLLNSISSLSFRHSELVLVQTRDLCLVDKEPSLRLPFEIATTFRYDATIMTSPEKC